MSLFGKISESLNAIVKNSYQSDDNFNQEEYHKYNNERIKEFKDRYDLTSVAGIRSIPVEEAKRYSDGGRSVVYMPEQILSRQATEYKNNQQYDLAIECLRKVNELYPLSFYQYTRDNYERLLKLKQIIYGWVNYFRIADMKMLLLREIDPWVRRKLRVIIWKQWKKIRRRYTCLRKLGISHRDAYVTANSRKGYYHIAHTRVIEAAISKERLNKRGLVNSLDHYLKVHVITN